MIVRKNKIYSIEYRCVGNLPDNRYRFVRGKDIKSIIKHNKVPNLSSIIIQEIKVVDKNCIDDNLHNYSFFIHNCIVFGVVSTILIGQFFTFRDVIKNHKRHNYQLFDILRDIKKLNTLYRVCHYRGVCRSISGNWYLVDRTTDVTTVPKNVKVWCVYV